MSSEFLVKIRRHMTAADGVVAVRTRDPVAVAVDLAIWGEQNKQTILIWDNVRGFLKSPNPISGTGRGNPDDYSLSDVFENIVNSEGDDEQWPEECVYVFMNPHLLLPEADCPPQAIQQLSNMAHGLSNTEKRVILTIPPHYQFPKELQELIPIVEHEPPDVEALSEVTKICVANYQPLAPKILKNFTENEYTQIAQAGVGMIEPEFESSMSRALNLLISKGKVIKADEVRTAMLDEKADMVRRNSSLEIMEPIPIEEVGGLDNLKEWIDMRKLAMNPLSWEAGVSKPKGCALVGPPGTGKSLCGKVIGTQLGVATIRFDLSSVFAGLVGQSEGNMRQALFMLKSLAPCVVLLDEVDKALNMNSGGDGGTSQKVLGQLLTFMQETKEPIFWAPTLNRTDNVPAEFLRTGRLDNVFGVSLPNELERAEILKIHMIKSKIDPDTVGDLSKIVRKTNNFVGAELEYIVQEARLRAYSRDEQTTVKHMKEALSTVRPLSKRMKSQFDAMKEWCENNAEPSSKVMPVIDSSKGGVRPRRRSLPRVN